jgi:hypothetical protein
MDAVNPNELKAFSEKEKPLKANPRKVPTQLKQAKPLGKGSQSSESVISNEEEGYHKVPSILKNQVIGSRDTGASSF